MDLRYLTITPVRRSLTSTKHRRDDPSTSRVAAQTAASKAADERRIRIRKALAEGGAMNYKQIAHYTGINGTEVARRLSEIAGIEPMDQKLDGCRLWRISI